MVKQVQTRVLTTAAVYEIPGIIHCSSVVLGIFTAVKKHLANERIISSRQNEKCLYPGASAPFVWAPVPQMIYLAKMNGPFSLYSLRKRS